MTNPLCSPQRCPVYSSEESPFLQHGNLVLRSDLTIAHPHLALPSDSHVARLAKRIYETPELVNPAMMLATVEGQKDMRGEGLHVQRAGLHPTRRMRAGLWRVWLH